MAKSALHPLDVPSALKISVAQRKRGWASYRPPAPRPQAEIPSTFAVLAATRKIEREAKRAARIERALARKATPDRIATQFKARRNNYMTAARFARILRELPTAEHRRILKAIWVPNGDGYQRAVVQVGDIQIGSTVIPTRRSGSPAAAAVAAPSGPRPNPSRRGDGRGLRPGARARPAVADDVAARTAGLDRTALLELAKANNFYKSSYDGLDNGRVVMTVRNVLRARIKRGEAVKWS